MTTLYRPVGLFEMKLILDLNLGGFPPRLPEQPIFYPVLNRPYAEQIASEWNTKDRFSGFAGYVTGFEVEDSYIAAFEEQLVGASMHRELWIPAEELDTFNLNIIGPIRVIGAFFSGKYTGITPEQGALAGMDADEQLLAYIRLREQGPDHLCSALEENWKLVYLNYLYWRGMDDAGSLNIDPSLRTGLLEDMKNHLKIIHQLDQESA